MSLTWQRAVFCLPTSSLFYDVLCAISFLPNFSPITDLLWEEKYPTEFICPSVWVPQPLQSFLKTLGLNGPMEIENRSHRNTYRSSHIKFENVDLLDRVLALSKKIICLSWAAPFHVQKFHRHWIGWQTELADAVAMHKVASGPLGSRAVLNTTVYSHCIYE